MSLLNCDCCGKFPCGIEEAIRKDREEHRQKLENKMWEKVQSGEIKLRLEDKEEELVVGHCDFTPEEQPRKFNAAELARAIEENQRRILENKKAEKPAEPKTAMRFTADKMRFDLLPIEALVELTRVYDSGALKYDDNNWRKGMAWSQVYRPIFSHFFKWLMGQTVDKETGCHHLAMVAWNCLTLVTYQLRRLGTDDRASTGFAIDDNFNWVDNHLELGLTTEKKKELKTKYEQERAKHK